MEWRSPASSRRKPMLITFFDSQGFIHKEFLPKGTTNAARYIEILNRFIKRLCRLISANSFLVKGGIPYLARSQSSRLLPIPTTQTRFEKKEI
ncbi:hypothetical protein TNCV_2862141 [Trichonephila clavipes]|nr:hypothetical protein TNCV_2862141 [Trichonephila clavipes]